ncbi:MAG: AAA domain-containing protein [Saprospiraceae bacterium]
MTVAEHFEKIEALLKIEKQEDFEQYRNLIQKLSLTERREQGYSWYPLLVTRTGYTVGERAFVIIERTKNLGKKHQFRAGGIVSLFTKNDGTHQPEKSGVVQYVKKDKMKVVLNSKDLPDWLNKGQLGIDVQFDERTYLEMERALKLVKKAKGDRIAELRDVILGKNEARFLSETAPTRIPQLNDSQNAAVTNVLAAQDVAVIHGPPGTGKTTTLVYAIELLCQTENTVLVTAPSNTAVDLMTERLAEKGLRTVRIGNISRVEESLVRHTLEFQLSNHPDAKHIKKVRQEAAEARRQVRKIKGKNWRERKMYQQEAYELSQWANQLEDRLLDQILDQAQVVCCTFVGSSNKILRKRKFRTVIIDEAAQALEPASWIAILKASKIVLAGDPFQLPPTVKSFKAQRGGLNVTLIERCIERLKNINFLNIQYRMNQAIMGFSNRIFYKNTLQAAPSVQFHQLSIENNSPVIFVDTAGCGFDEKINEEYQSRYNPDEFQILCEHLYQLVDAIEPLEEKPSIALISPYREQVIHMKNVVDEDPKLQDVPLVIKTIDGFQGQEKDVVYISLVRSNSKQEIGFLKDYRRMNVAMTRARKQLIVVGDSATIGSNEFYQQFLAYCEEEAVYQTAWEYML